MQRHAILTAGKNNVSL